MYDIVQDQPYRKLMERGLIHEVEQGKPDYVVLVNQRLSWLADTRAELGPLTDWIIQFTDNYEPFGAVSAGRLTSVCGDPTVSRKYQPAAQHLSEEKTPAIDVQLHANYLFPHQRSNTVPSGKSAQFANPPFIYSQPKYL